MSATLGPLRTEGTRPTMVSTSFTRRKRVNGERFVSAYRCGEYEIAQCNWYDARRRRRSKRLVGRRHTLVGSRRGRKCRRYGGMLTECPCVLLLVELLLDFLVGGGR